MARVLLINPSMEKVYVNARVIYSVPNYIPLNLLTIATPLREAGHRVKLLDLNNKPIEELENELARFKPDFVGITFTTPQYSQSIKIVDKIKEFDPRIIVVVGGAHVTAKPSSTLRNSKIDIAVLGEGDFTFLDIVASEKLEAIKGIAFKKNNGIKINDRRPYLESLDDLPFPSIELVEIKDYEIPYAFCEENPVAPIETSRGCPYGCVYCNKSIFGKMFRAKSPQRVLEEAKRLEEMGFREIHIVDDGFSNDRKRAMEICRLLIENNIKLHWNCSNGIRADKVDTELLGLMKKAGFYRVSIGVESGSQRVLDRTGKMLKKEKIEKAFKLCRKAGIETLAFFMFGLPGETEEDMKKTIEFAKQLEPNIVKFDIMIPLPSTPIFEEWRKKGLISKDWDNYCFHTEKKAYDHPNMEWETITKYISRAYKSFYFSPRYIVRRLKRSLIRGCIIKDLKLFFKIKW